MAKRKKLSEETISFFRQIGRKGGRARAKNHSKRKRKEWAELGGRPSRSPREQAVILEKRFRSAQELRQLRFDAKTKHMEAVAQMKKEQFEQRCQRLRNKFEAAQHNRRRALRFSDEAFEGSKTKALEQFNKHQAFRISRFHRGELARVHYMAKRLRNFQAAQAAWQKDFETQYELLLKKQEQAAQAA